MASIKVENHQDRLKIISQAFCCDIHDTWENRKVLFVFLRVLCSPETGKPLFSYQRLADAFGYQARQNIHNYVREYEQCNENLFDYLRHKRKVDPGVGEVVREELRQNMLITSGSLRIRVNQRLGREDLSPANIRVALEQIPCTVIRQRVLREIEQGAFHPKEEVVLAELFAAFAFACEPGDAASKDSVHIRSFSPLALPVNARDVVAINSVAAAAAAVADERGEPICDAGEEMRGVSQGQAQRQEEFGDSEQLKLLRYAELVSAAGIEAIREEPDEAVIQKIQADAVGKLLSPHVDLSEIPASVVGMVKAMTMYHSGASVSRIGCWFGGKAKSTIYTWIMGLSLALWPVIQGWVWSHVKGRRVYIDEKWLKLRKKWHYLFVAVDHDSGLPLFHDLLPTRSKWACRLFVLKLKRLGKLSSLIMTDGLKGYVSAIAKIFPRAKHLLCLFHHQQSVTRCVNEHFCETEQKAANVAKKRMKQVIRTNDTRTVR